MACFITGVVLQITWWIAYAQSPQVAPQASAGGYASFSLLQSVVGALVGGGLLWVMRAAFFYIRGIEGMGLGDIKLMAFVGAFLGWQLVLLVLLLGTILGSVIGGMAALISRQGMKFRFPFGVPLGISALFVLFFGQAIMQWYVALLNP
jgi:leader peptidase (prepilin peptidase)/N-methyltransferase